MGASLISLTVSISALWNCFDFDLVIGAGALMVSCEDIVISNVPDVVIFKIFLM